MQQDITATYTLMNQEQSFSECLKFKKVHGSHLPSEKQEADVFNRTESQNGTAATHRLKNTR